MQVGEVVVLVEDVDGVEAGHERSNNECARQHGHGRLPIARPLAGNYGAHLGGSAAGALPPFVREGEGTR